VSLTYSILTTEYTVIGERLCGNLRLLRPVRPIVRHHHERLDGSGYPDGLRGDEIALLAQIVGIVDVYDALTSTRPYRSALLPEEAFEELGRDVSDGARRQDLVDAFVALGRSGRLKRRAQAPRVDALTGSRPN
jgi:cyclic di-GMP phosphodiesterase